MAATHSRARTAVLRSALLFCPFLVVALIAFAFMLRETVREGASGGGIVVLVLVGGLGLLLVYQVLQSVRDLFSQLVETTGVVKRRWNRNDFFLFRNGYIFVGRDVYRLSPERFIDIDLGDTVRIVHYPHTATVESIEVLERAGSEEPADG
ncbi:MAG: hypothetical protein IH959_01395 [Chloroflexi bacterium]|nr:hypothetical protein [Chloroflexota bacterium]